MSTREGGILRPPVVAGQFYPSEAAALEGAVEGYLHRKESAPYSKEDGRKVTTIVVPHAGYIYSGDVAGTVFSTVQIPDRVILIGPNHTGRGADISIMGSGTWQVPTGTLDIDTDLARKITVEAEGLITENVDAHLGEHSLEVQLPFIIARNPDAKIVPITVMRASLEACKMVGEAIGAVVEKERETGSDILIVVSSDMDHYESDELTRAKDRAAIDYLLALDPSGLIHITSEKDITMCGVMPAAIAINAAKALGSSKAELIDYDTSATASGDYTHVVGYAGVVIE